jgi:hypothetical protein
MSATGLQEVKRQLECQRFFNNDTEEGQFVNTLTAGMSMKLKRVYMLFREERLKRHRSNFNEFSAVREYVATKTNIITRLFRFRGRTRTNM